MGFFTQPTPLIATQVLTRSFYFFVVAHLIDVTQFNPSPVEGEFGSFQFLAITNKAVTNICLQFCV